ncbi:MAG: hypothetical protein K0S12_1590, partial [Bacteroidetes bacterium]|nr:hypothetical protein [Bacteroidota bacterium]
MYSKYLIVLFFQFLLIRIYSQNAGDFSLSGRAGVGQSIIQSKSTGFSTSSSRLSLSAGLLSDYWFNENVSLETGVILISKGGEIVSDQTIRNENMKVTSRYELLYGEIPLTPKFTHKYNRFNLHIYTGPAVNLLFSSRATQSNEQNSDPYLGHEGEQVQNISRADYALVYGFGINSFFQKTGNFFADIRISQDISSFA